MGTFLERTDPRFVEVECLPEYFITGVGKSEFLQGALIRNYMCSPRGNLLVPQYMSVVPVHCMALMARGLMALAAEQNNTLALGNLSRPH